MSDINPLASSYHLLKRLERDIRDVHTQYAGTHLQKPSRILACYYLGASGCEGGR